MLTMVKLLSRIVSVLLKLVGAVIGLFLLIFALKYITCPVFDFQESRPFAGDLIYNPYEGMDPSMWRKGNFQIQSYAWGGLTAGWKNSNDEIWDLYRSLGYEIIGTSDYQKINRYGEGKPGYIPVYEHGYGITKAHQVLIGAGRVLWKDYPLFQTRHNKQHIINRLRGDNALIFLAHPLLRNGYSIRDMELLSGYDGIEVLNNFRFSLEHWDAALSAGNYVTVLSNDDAHDLHNPDEIGQHCTFINTPTLDGEDILDAFRAGRTYGAKIWRPLGESIPDKIERTKVIPMLLRHEVKGDTLIVECDSVVRFIRFIGQGGEVLKTDFQTELAAYPLRDSDTYVRAEIHFWNESALYMNPVCRYDGSFPAKIAAPEANIFKTWLLRITGFTVLFAFFAGIFLLRKRSRAA